MISYKRWQPEGVDGGIQLGDFFSDLKGTLTKIGNTLKPVEGVTESIKNLVKPTQTPAVLIGEPNTEPEYTGAAPAPIETPTVHPAVWAVGGLGVAALLFALVGRKK